MDVYTYQYYYNSVLSKLDITYVVERKFDMDNYYYGMSFFRMDDKNQATPEEWRTCLEEYIHYNYHFRDKMERHYRNTVFDLVNFIFIFVTLMILNGKIDWKSRRIILKYLIPITVVSERIATPYENLQSW